MGIEPRCGQALVVRGNATPGQCCAQSCGARRSRPIAQAVQRRTASHRKVPRRQDPHVDLLRLNPSGQGQNAGLDLTGSSVSCTRAVRSSCGYYTSCARPRCRCGRNSAMNHAKWQVKSYAWNHPVTKETIFSAMGRRVGTIDATAFAADFRPCALTWRRSRSRSS